MLKIKNHELYSDFVTGIADYQRVLDHLRATPVGKKFLDDNYGVALEIQLAACRAGTRMDDVVKNYETASENGSLSKDNRERAAMIAKMIKDHCYHWFRGVDGCLNYVIQKIELVSQFET